MSRTGWVLVCFALAAVFGLLSLSLSNAIMNRERAENPDWPWDRIERHELWIGMTERQAELSVGQTLYKNKTITATGVSEQWVYDTSDTPITSAILGEFSGYLYFENGLLVAIQTGF
jgi:hypothetical protein